MTRLSTAILVCLAVLLAIALAVAQSQVAQSQGVEVLLSKARSLEARGRTDLAAQNWKQVLLANPNQTEALAGLARYAKQTGDTNEERGYIDRLKRINPKNPEIAAIENMHVLTPQERDRLDEAGRLAMQHKPDDAMKIYRQVFGSQPPSGRWAEFYYETEAASTGGRPQAIAQLRELCKTEPDNEIYRFWLARILINDPKSRMEGLQDLESIRDPGAAEQARTLWKQALLWEKQNPAVLPFVNAYLQRYPDEELQGIQKSLQQQRERIAQDASKARAFQALRGKDLATAEAKFQDVLQRSPNDVNAIAGLAFVRLNQKRFDEAASLFERAQTLAPKRSDIQEGYNTARLWSSMQRGATSLQQKQPQPAIAAYKQALSIQPDNVDAMLGVAQAEVQQNRLPEAEAQFQEVLTNNPNNVDAISGLGFLRIQQKRFDEAVNLFDQARRLEPNRAEFQSSYNDAKYWSLMQKGSTDLDRNEIDAAVSDYNQALRIRPAGSDALKALAGALERGKRYPQAAQIYQQLTRMDPNDPKLWLSSMQVQLLSNDAGGVIRTASQIPPAVNTHLEANPIYVSDLALAYYRTGNSAQGNRMLDRETALARQNDPAEALNARLEIASILMKQDQVARAIQIYQQATSLHPQNAIAWEGLVGAYLQERDYSRAQNALRTMPPATFNDAAQNAGFLNSVAAVYSAYGECTKAEQMLNRSLNLARSADQQTLQGARLQLADIWMREGNYGKAGKEYQGIVASDPNSVDAWRGYLTVLHNQGEDRTALAEAQRIPPNVHNQLEHDSGFLVVMAGVQSSSGNNPEALRLLREAQHLYVANNEAPPADLQIQLAWAMLNDPQSDPRLFLQKLKSRSDLSPEQQATVNQIQAMWTVHAAEEAMQQKNPQRATVLLTGAQRDLPNDPKIYAELASVYARQHDYARAMDIYRAWGMKGATADDYRAAAGSAIAWHKQDVADSYINEGLQFFPNDPGLLEMKGRQDVARGNYKEGQSYLKLALSASRHPVQHQSFLPDNRHPSSPSATPTRPARGNSGNTLSNSAAPACKDTVSYSLPRRAHFMLASTVEVDDGGTESDQSQTASDNDQNQQTSSAQDMGTATHSDPTAVNQPASALKQEELQDEIDVVQNRNTPYSDVGSDATGRAGDPGIDRLIIEDGFLGGSAVAGNKLRLDISAHGLFLYSGTPDGRSKSRFGTLAPGAMFPKQYTGGVTGELQLSTPTLGLEFSATPRGFPVQNVLGGIRFRPFDGPFTFTATRDSVKDSMLSYAGVGDPGTGIVWGGVVANTGIVQFDHKSPRFGQFASATFSYLTGQHVPNNWSASGTAGFYFVVGKGFSVGLSATAMHYDQNLSFFSLGHGGYFSPQRYGLASVPISWFARHKRFEYEIRASLGAQYIQQDASPIFPTRLNTNPPNLGFYASTTDVGPNYSFLGRLGYRLAPHVYLDTYATASNARNYASQTVGFSLKFLVHRLPTHTDLRANSVPDWKGNQPFALY